MLTKLTVRNFKIFEDVEIELGDAVVFIGPNNSGKTAALQALALWDVGLKRWHEKRAAKPEKLQRPGVAINRRDLISLPVPNANLLWRNLHVRDVQREDGKLQTNNVRIDVIVEGVSNTAAWQCGLEFDFANDESIYCRPLRLTDDKKPQRMAIPEEATKVRIAFLPPMSGLAATEYRLDPGAINVLLGEGRTAEVLRNLCYQILTSEGGKKRWQNLCEWIEGLFGVALEEPQYLPERGEIAMTYRSRENAKLDLSSSGRGLQQTLLLLAHLAANPGSVLLLDEPDAHLEILRQRQIYQILVESARELESQVIAASHSEIVLAEAADRDVVVAFLGKPHRIDDRGSQVLKSLKEIGFDQYYQAEQAGWVIYLEGSTDLAILRTLAQTLGHPAAAYLSRPFVHYVRNLPGKARDHFRGLKEAKRDLVGIAIFDRIDMQLQSTPELTECQWRKREIENYICLPDVLLAYARGSVEAESPGPLFASTEAQHREKIMHECISDLVPPVALRDPLDPWWSEVKASDDFLDRLFRAFYDKLRLPNLMRKSDYHVLARYVRKELIDPETATILDRIVEVAGKAHPAAGEG
jgi:ABC-type lipoprotein export system ATPase subunit